MSKKIGQANLPLSVYGLCKQFRPFSTASVFSAFFSIQRGGLRYRGFDSPILIHLPCSGPGIPMMYLYPSEVFLLCRGGGFSFTAVDWRKSPNKEGKDLQMVQGGASIENCLAQCVFARPLTTDIHREMVLFQVHSYGSARLRWQNYSGRQAGKQATMEGHVQLHRPIALEPFVG